MLNLLVRLMTMMMIIIIIIIIITIIHLLLLLLYSLYVYFVLSLWLWQSNSVLILIHHFNSNFDCNICCFSRTLELLSKPFKWYSIFFSTLFLVPVHVRPSSETAYWDIPLYHLWTHLRSSHSIYHPSSTIHPSSTTWNKKISIVFMRWNNLCKDNRSLPARVSFLKKYKNAI